MGVDNRFMLAGIAEALECSVVDLSGQQPIPTDPDGIAAQLAVAAIRQALVETDLTEPATVMPRPLPELAADVQRIWDLRLECDYAGAGRLLPGVLRELHAATSGPQRPAALRLLARTTDVASFVTRYVGFPAESWLASERAHDAALALEDPVILGLSAWSRGHAATGCGAYPRALHIAEASLPGLERAYDAPGGAEMLGQMQMLGAFACIAQGRRDDALTWAQEADRIAARTGDTTTLGLMFGPTNLQFWRISMEVDGGEPGRAVEIAHATTPAAVPAASRQVSFYSDTGRALARLGRDDDALRMLLTAERVAPQRLRASSLARETVRIMADRSTGSKLRGLAERMGLSL
jgi:hypothetical protein